MELMQSDTDFIVRNLPKDVRDLMKKHPDKLFVAGGFCRAIIAGEKVNDIDLWAGGEAFLTNIVKALAASRAAAGQQTRIHESDNALTLITHSPDRATIQAITRWKFADPVELVDSFDFTICQAAVWWGRQRGDANNNVPSWQSECSRRFYPDLAARRLFYTSPRRVEEAGGSLLRVLKYIKRGYSIQIGSLAAVVARLEGALKPEAINEAMRGRAPEYREEFVSRVLHGLLREVDPSLAIDGDEVRHTHDGEAEI